MAIKVRYKTGSRITCCSAAVAYREIERNRKENGGTVDLNKLVTNSKPKDAPLHNAFSWNDKEAAHKFRVQEARYIVRSIEVVDQEVSEPYRAYESVEVEVVSEDQEDTQKVEHVYRSTKEVMSTQAGRDMLLQKAIRDMYTFKKKYAVLSELAIVMASIDETLGKLAG